MFYGLFFFDLDYLILVIPPMLLGLYAQYKVKSSFAQMSEVPTRMSGAEAARRMLDSANLNDVGIEMIGGELSDHYDPRAKVLRLSHAVYQGHSMASVGVACHEAGHAIQDARRYAPLVIRNAAVPIAGFGSNISMFLFIGGILASFQPLIWAGVIAFATVVFFQVVNLPVEFDASARARRQLVDHGLISAQEERYVAKVLNAAALTYVAATLQAIMTLLYLLLRASGSRD